MRSINKFGDKVTVSLDRVIVGISVQFGEPYDQAFVLAFEIMDDINFVCFRRKALDFQNRLSVSKESFINNTPEFFFFLYKTTEKLFFYLEIR